MYKRQVNGQDIYRQQGLILNFNILHTFCNNVKKYFEVGPLHSGLLLQKITDEAFKGMCIQAAHGYEDLPYQGVPVILTRISIWPLHEPVVSSYGDRKEALLERWKVLSKRCKAHQDSKSDEPVKVAIYTSRCPGAGEDSWHTQDGETVPTKLRESRHFKRVMDIVQTKTEKYGLCHDETNPSKKSNWVYYCVMFDPTVSSEAADQGYIGETDRDLVTRWKEHVGSKGKHDDSLVHYNLSLVNQYAQQRGKKLSDYVAVFALGSTSEEIRKDVEGMLIRESLDGDFSVTNMKYGMNDKRASKKPNEQRFEHRKDPEEEESKKKKLREERKRREEEERKRREEEERKRREEEERKRREEEDRKRREEEERKRREELHRQSVIGNKKHPQTQDWTSQKWKYENVHYHKQSRCRNRVRPYHVPTYNEN